MRDQTFVTSPMRRPGNQGARRPQVHEARHLHQEEERRRQTIESSRFVYTEQLSAILKEKLTVYKFHKQSTKRGMQSQDSPPQVVQPQPKQGATVKIEAWRLVCARGSAERVLLQRDHSTDVWRSTTVGPIYSNPEQLARQKSDDTWGPDPSPSAWTCAMPPPTRTWMTRRLQPWSEVATHSERCMQLAQQISP